MVTRAGEENAPLITRILQIREEQAKILGFETYAEVSLERKDTEHDFYFELTMNDVWVWDVYRADRFVKSVRVLTFKDVNVEELGKKDLKLPRELAIDE